MTVVCPSGRGPGLLRSLLTDFFPGPQNGPKWSKMVKKGQKKKSPKKLEKIFFLRSAAWGLWPVKFEPVRTHFGTQKGQTLGFLFFLADFAAHLFIEYLRMNSATLYVVVVCWDSVVVFSMWSKKVCVRLLAHSHHGDSPVSHSSGVARARRGKRCYSKATAPWR